MYANVLVKNPQVVGGKEHCLRDQSWMQGREGCLPTETFVYEDGGDTLAFDRETFELVKWHAQSGVNATNITARALGTFDEQAFLATVSNLTSATQSPITDLTESVHVTFLAGEPQNDVFTLVWVGFERTNGAMLDTQKYFLKFKPHI